MDFEFQYINDDVQRVRVLSDNRSSWTTILPHTLVDPGNPEYSRHLAKFLQDHTRTSPDDIDHIILTHAHFDHIGYPLDFPNARVYMTAEERDCFLKNPEAAAWTSYEFDGQNQGNAGRKFIESFRQGQFQIHNLDEILDRVVPDGSPLSNGYALLPGHTPGHAILFYDDFMIAGDAFLRGSSPTSVPNSQRKLFRPYFASMTVLQGHDSRQYGQALDKVC